MNRTCLLIIFAILLGATLMIRPVHALIDAKEKEFISCEVLENDPDFLLNVTDCSSDLKFDLTFNPLTTKNTLTGWFNMTDESNKTVFSQQFVIKKSVNPKIPITLNVKNLTSKMFLKWGLNSSTVSVTENSVYRVTSGDTTQLNSAWYSIDLQKTGCSEGKTCGSETNLTIMGYNLPQYSSANAKRLSSSTNSKGMDYANTSLIENGLVRIAVYSINNTGNFYVGSTYWNWTSIGYFTPRYYTMNYIATGNDSWRYAYSTSTPFAIYVTTFYASNDPRLQVWNGRYINGTKYDVSYDVGAGADTYTFGVVNEGVNRRVAFMYDSNNHNKSILYLGTKTNSTQTINQYGRQDTSEYVNMGFHNPTVNSAGTYTLSYLVMFGHNGLTAVANNETVWNLDFNEQYQAWYNPATMTAITGTQKGRNNLTGSYNYSANGTLADFNFSTVVGMNYTYPIFEVQNLSSISNIISHVWWKNYTNSSDWIQLTNYSDFVIQEGNSTFFGYDYILILLNKTLGRETANSETYELWISNTSDPYIEGETSPFTRTFNVPTKDATQFNKLIALTKSFNVPSKEYNTFMRNPIVQRMFNILSEPTNNFFKGFGFIRITNVQTKEYVQVSRNIILERTLNANEKTSNTFSALLVEGLKTFERFLNIGTNAADSFFYLITGVRFLNVPTKDANQFSRTIIVTKFLNVSTKDNINFFRNTVVEKLFNVSQKESNQFSRTGIISRLLNIQERMNVSWLGQLPYNIFERLLSIPLDLIDSFIVYVRVWEQPSIYQVCSILQQIGDSRAYLCIYDTGEWKILIRGV